jgi:hypothetical protein
MVGTMGPGKPIEACNVFHAVAEAAGCSVHDVCLPIWIDWCDRWGAAGIGCFMPLDQTGRQWLAVNTAGHLAAEYRISP